MLQPSHNIYSRITNTVTTPVDRHAAAAVTNPTTEMTVEYVTPRKYVFDVTSVGQRSLPWPCKLTERRDKISRLVLDSFSLRTIYVAVNASN